MLEVYEACFVDHSPALEPQEAFSVPPGTRLKAILASRYTCSPLPRPNAFPFCMSRVYFHVFCYESSLELERSRACIFVSGCPSMRLEEVGMFCCGADRRFCSL